MKFNKASKTIIVTTFIAWIVIGLAFYQKANAAENHENPKINPYESSELFGVTLHQLKNNYVDTLQTQELYLSAIKGMLEDLDPHTNFFTPEDFKDFETETSGEFGGLGITIEKQGDYITVVSPLEGTPAYKMGIMAGDKIVKVDGEDVIGISTKDIIKKMRGPKGTKIVVSIQRPGVKDEIDFEIIRDIIKIHSVPYSFVLDNGIGYLRIRQFSKNTAKELDAALDKLEAQNIRGLVIDLRFNPGGLLGQAVDTVNEFVGNHKLVVYTKGRISSSNHEYYTKHDEMRTGYPIIVMINEASASAAEIFSGSLQDYDKALIVGKKSFGKGSVQRLFPLPKGYGIKITVAKYYIKSGRCVHKDLNDKLLKSKRIISKAEYKKLEKESEAKEKKQVFHTQNGRIVYGGGGITPDIEIDQSKLTNLAMELRRKNEVFKYAVDYMIKNEDDVSKDFVPDKKLVNNFIEHIKKDSISFTETELDSTYSWIKNSLRSEIIGKKFGQQESYKIAINEDTQLQEALKIFDKNQTLDDMFKYAKALKQEKGKVE